MRLVWFVCVVIGVDCVVLIGVLMVDGLLFLCCDDWLLVKVCCGLGCCCCDVRLLLLMVVLLSLSLFVFIVLCSFGSVVLIVLCICVCCDMNSVCVWLFVMCSMICSGLRLGGLSVSLVFCWCVFDRNIIFWFSVFV